jgi:uroporphyrinogen-III decarboxylase
MTLQKLIEKLKKMIDFERIEKCIERQMAAWNYRPVDYPPLIVNCPPPYWWPDFKYIETFYDMEKMLISELAAVYQHCLIQDDYVPCVRANYGVVVIPGSFGCEIRIPDNVRVFEKTYAIGPWAKPVINKDPPTLKDLRRPDIRNEGLTRMVLETEGYFMQKLEDTGVRVCACDTQGPLDNAHMLRGSKIITDMYKHPTFVEDLLELMSDFYIEFNREQKKVIREELTQGVTKGVGDGIWMDKGGVRLCADSLVVLSPKLYERFCKPAHERCLRSFNGGILHVCGDINHLLEEIKSTKGVRAINLGNPEMYKLRELHEYFRDKACVIWTGYPEEKHTIEEWIENVAADLGDERTGIIFSLYEGANNLERAQEIVKKWKEYFLRSS